jgi:O-antigen/teichoic acid export membrane protein
MLQPAAVVGIYSVAYRPLGPLNLIPFAVLTALFPSFARMAGQDRAALARAFASSLRLMWVVSLPIAVVISAFAEPIVIALAGPGYRESAIPLRVLIWITSLSFLSFQFRFLFAALGKSQIYLRLIALVFLMEAVVEAALIPSLGYLGACLGSLLGEMFFTVAGLVLCQRLGIGGVEYGTMARATLAAAAIGGAIGYVRGASQHPAVTGIISIILIFMCGLSFVLLGCIRRGEILQLAAAIKGVLRSVVRP